MAALETFLQGMIAGQGPISVGAYMAMCLGHPQHGYYMSREPFGTAGDFVTAPEISQLFGEMLGLWVIIQAENLAADKRIQLVELGPGRGTLMKDIWRSLSVMPELRARIEVHLVEFSPRLQAIQRDTLDGVPVMWHQTIETLPEQQSIIIANEFFDALPIEQAVYHRGAWHQQLVGNNNGKLFFTPGKILQGIHVDKPKEGDLFEYAPMATEIMMDLTQFIVENKGAMVAIDYGDDVPIDHRIGDTLQAIYHGDMIGVLEKTGESDLTAHVAFAALAQIGKECGATVQPIVTQREFLTQLGIRLRAEKLLASATEVQSQQIQSGLRRLIDPVEMGDLFKVLQVTS